MNLSFITVLAVLTVLEGCGQYSGETFTLLNYTVKLVVSFRKWLLG